MKKIDFWNSCILQSQTEVFETLREFLKENELQLSSEVKQHISDHLKGLESSFVRFFPKPDEANLIRRRSSSEENFQSEHSIAQKESLS